MMSYTFGRFYIPNVWTATVSSKHIMLTRSLTYMSDNFLHDTILLFSYVFIRSTKLVFALDGRHFFMGHFWRESSWLPGIQGIGSLVARSTDTVFGMVFHWQHSYSFVQVRFWMLRMSTAVGASSTFAWIVHRQRPLLLIATMYGQQRRSRQFKK